MVGRWLLGQRLAYAQCLHGTTPQPVDTIAQMAGFGSAASLREHFSRAYHILPSAYRSAFGQA